MRACIQRVSRANVSVDGQSIGEIGQGLVVLLGVGQGDQDFQAISLATKITELRIFNDQAGKMNRSLIDVAGSVLAISQFTLYGDARKGRRPSFVAAADPETGRRLYQRFVDEIRSRGVPIGTGQFQADMQVELVNDGPVTILLDTDKLF